MTTTNPHELARVKARNEAVAETERMFAEVESTTAETIESVIAERDALKAQLKDQDEMLSTTLNENSVLRAEVERLTNQPIASEDL